MANSKFSTTQQRQASAPPRPATRTYAAMIALFAALSAFILYVSCSSQSGAHSAIQLGIFAGSIKATYSEPTASTANPTASSPSVHHGRAYIEYSTIPGFFQQDLKSTDPATFDYVGVQDLCVGGDPLTTVQTASNFGLLNRTYPNEQQSDLHLPQWARFNRYLTRLSDKSSAKIQYKLIFIGRHGQGFHNVAEEFFETPAWNCYWAQANGNGTLEWADAHLTSIGVRQAEVASNYWSRLLAEQDIIPPMAFYVSPLYRCLQTAQIAYSSLTNSFNPTIKELLREGISIHSCDRRSNRTAIASAFPGYSFEHDFTETDTLWSGVTKETPSAQDYRSKVLLDDIFTSDQNAILSFTTHSGEMASLLRVVGHIPFAVGTGQIIPVLVKAETHRGSQVPTTTRPWSASAWCTNGPPITSRADCSCRDGVKPTAVSPGIVFTSAL